MVLPDTYIDHDSPQKQYAEAGLTAQHIVDTALAALDKTTQASGLRA